MIWIDLGHHFTVHLGDLVSWPDLNHGLLGAWDWNQGLALFNTDPFAGTRTFFSNFFKTGQAWALLIGVILGYVLRGFTTYG